MLHDNKIFPSSLNDSFPLATNQRDVWLDCQINPDVSKYNIGGYIVIESSVDEAMLHQIFKRLITRHDVLRLEIVEGEDGPLQRVLPNVALDLPFVDFSVSENPLEAARAWMEQDMQRTFDMYRAPLWRFAILRLSAEQYCWYYTFHHLISDGVSVHLLATSLTEIYYAHIKGDVVDKAPDYREVISSDYKYVHSDSYVRDGIFWEQQFQTIPPAIFSAANGSTDECGSLDFTLSAVQAEKLRAFAASIGSSGSQVVLSLLYLYFSRMGNTNDLVIGVATHNRRGTRERETLGFFSQIIPVRLALASELTFVDAINESTKKLRSCYKHARFSQGDIQHRIGLQKSTISRLFDIELSFIPSDYGTTIIGKPATPFMYIANKQEQMPLRVYCFDDVRNGVYRFYFNHNLSYISSSEMEQIVDRFDYLLAQVIANPNQPLCYHSLATQQEIEKLLQWSKGQLIPTSEETVVQLFEHQAARSPNAIALTFNEQSLSYGELNNQANCLAHRLIRLGVKPETLVGLCMERSVEMLIALLAILKAGGAYVPIGADYPEARIRYQLEDSGVTLLLTQDKLVESLPKVEGIQILDVLQGLRSSADECENPSLAIAPRHLAYVIYTSGSTGKPKGVMVEHRSLSNLLLSMPDILNFTATDKFLALTSISFDISIIEIFMPLTVGGEVVLTPSFVSQDFAALTSLIQQEKPSHIQATPATWRGIHQGITYPQLKVVMSGGEAVDEALAKSLAAIAPSSYNLYGPTETTVWSSARQLQNTMSFKSIGRPIGNTQMYILDEHFQLLPPGIPGELYIGGAGLARGYLNRPELTAERFVVLELFGEMQRLYRTGDRVCWNSDGELEFLGRLDYQIKLRGHRIELGEIEAVLREHEQVEQALVVVKGEAENSRLVGYIVPRQQEEAQLRLTHLDHWHSLWNSQYQNTTQLSDGPADFDITGWNNSYTGETIPADEMAIWVDETVAQIHKLYGSRVLEIGCGTGLLLTRLAVGKERYIGLDFSEAVLARLGCALAARTDLAHVELRQGLAHELSFLEDQSIDLVIINSVVQYFTDIDYLLEVFNQLCRICTTDARIFMGDIRNLTLLEDYHASVIAHRADENALLEWVRSRVRKAIQDEQELLLAPAFFEALAQHWPGVARAELRLKPGSYDNELSRFRYDVCLTLGERQKLSSNLNWCNWDPKGLWREELIAQIKADPQQSYAVRGVPDLRISEAMQYRKVLADAEYSYQPLKDVRKNFVWLGEAPDELYKLAKTLNVELIWQNLDADGCYQAIFNPKWEVAEKTKALASLDYRHYANSPARRELQTTLGMTLKSELMIRLPEYMVPSAIMVLEQFPLTPNGKIDRASLPELSTLLSERTKDTYVPPRTPQEQSLVELWQAVLMLAEAPGVKDNFFDLGGNSLLSAKVAAYIEKKFGCKISLKSFFKQPTIESIAMSLQQEVCAEQDVAIPVAIRWQLPDELRYKLESYIGSWEGIRASEDSLIVGRNLDGKRPPLFWVFQGEREFYQLASYLGSDQPIYGMRSGHLIMDYTEDNIQYLALRYMAEIEMLCPQGPLFVGGNCQAGIIALAIAQHLQRRQKNVLLTFLMEWIFGEMFGVQPYLGPVALLYGKDSVFNPYLSYRQPELYWKRAFPSYRMEFIPGKHGRFFEEPNILGFSETVSRCMTEALVGVPLFIPPAERRAELCVIDNPETVYAGSSHLLVVKLRNVSTIAWNNSDISGLMLGNRWFSVDGELIVQQDGRAPLPLLLPGESILLHLPVHAPVHSGEVVLNITLVEEGVCWFSGSESGEVRLQLSVVARPAELLNETI